MKYQNGMGFLGIFLICTAIVLVAVGGMKVGPSYMEFYGLKDAIFKVQGSGATSVADIKRAFEKQVEINNFKSIGSTDLEITRDGNDVVISFAYPKKIHMFNNVHVCIDFAATTAPGGVAPEPAK
jgi:hypothetical protein